MDVAAFGTWAVRPGRGLVWAPPWDDSDAVLVFDAHSGDYWVLSLPAAAQLRALTDEDGAATAPDAELLAELQQSGLVVPVG